MLELRNLLFLLILANVLYFLWAWFVGPEPEAGVAIIDESELGPKLEVKDNEFTDAASVGALLDSGGDLSAAIGRSCVTIGPFREQEDAEEAQTRYAAEGMRTRVRSLIGQIFVGHWVQIRNIETRDAADAMVDKLGAGGLGESYIFEDVDGIHISIGLFNDVERAERTEIQASSLELPAEILPRFNEGTVYLVDLALPPGRGAAEIVAQYGEQKVALRDKATCPNGN